MESVGLFSKGTGSTERIRTLEVTRAQPFEPLRYRFNTEKTFTTERMLYIAFGGRPQSKTKSGRSSGGCLRQSLPGTTLFLFSKNKQVFRAKFYHTLCSALGTLCHLSSTIESHLFQTVDVYESFRLCLGSNPVDFSDLRDALCIAHLFLRVV